MIHFHKYKMIDSNKQICTKLDGYMAIKNDVTRILFRCEKCGKLITKVIEGHWDNLEKII